MSIHRGEVPTALLENPMEEFEPMPKYRIFMLGAGRGTGRTIANRFATEGYPVIGGSRSLEHINGLSTEIWAAGGVEPIPFTADTTDPKQVKRAYESLNLEPGEPLHFFQFSAGGFDKLLFSLGRFIATLQRAHRKDEVTVELLEKLTNEIYDFVRNGKAKGENVIDCATDVNITGPVMILDMLIANGHIREGSRIATLSSNISNETDPNKLKSGLNNRGPQLYLPIGWTKEKAVQICRERADEVGAIHIDGVAPAIEKTETAEVFTGSESLRNRKPTPIYGLVEIVERALAKLSPEERAQRGIELPLFFPVVTQEEVAEAMFKVLMRANFSQTVYIERGGKISNTRPEKWNKHPALLFL